MPQPITVKKQTPCGKPPEENKRPLPEKRRKDKFPMKIEKDDLILAGVLVVLLMNDCDDWLLIAVIGGLLLLDT